MKNFLLLVGRLVFIIAWPFWRWYFPRHPRTRLLIVCGDDVLVLRGWLGDGKWSLPGGGLHRGEDPLRAVLREAKEEIGVDLLSESVRRLGDFTLSEKGITTSYIAFAVVLEKKPTIRLQWNEIAVAKWVTVDQVEADHYASATFTVLYLWRKCSKTAII